MANPEVIGFTGLQALDTRLSPRRARGPGRDERRALARERAIMYLVDQRLEERRAADGRCVGIQSCLATSPSGKNAIDLYRIVDGMVMDSEARATVFAEDPVGDLWQEIANWVRQRLGFPLEPELFSNMLYVAHLGVVDHPYVKRIARELLSTFRNSHAHGLYHFFTSLRFAGDVDCTAMAARARIVAGDFDFEQESGRADLRQITDRILGSAAVCDVEAEDNTSHGKNNGALRRGVFKVYLDDHEIHGAAYDRGLKINPVVVANALFPVLFELSMGLRDPGEVIKLKEFPPGSELPRTGHATVSEIVAANLAFLAGHILTGRWREGCRYYPSPDAFLCFYSELVREYPEVADMFGMRGTLEDAIEERREAEDDGITDPNGTLNTSLRAIAAQNFGVDAWPELEHLMATQEDEGGWSDYAALYCLGTNNAPRVYFGSPVQTAAFAARALSRTPRQIAPVDPSSRQGWVGDVVKHLVDVMTGR